MKDLIKQPRYIVMDGMDGCGKDTQIDMLYDYLAGQGANVMKCRTPTANNPLGDHIRSLFDNAAEMWPDPEHLALAMGSLMIADMMQFDLEVRRKLSEGYWVVESRSWTSTYSYQGASSQLREMAMRVGEVLRRPDIVFVFDLPIEECVRRIKARAFAGQQDEVELYEREDRLVKTFGHMQDLLRKWRNKRWGVLKTIMCADTFLNTGGIRWRKRGEIHADVLRHLAFHCFID